MAKLRVLRYSILQSTVMGFAGIVGGLLYFGIGFFIDLSGPGLNHGTALALFAVPVMPLYFAAFGFLTGIVGANLYNFSLRWISGVSLKVDK
jgi:hypothetical protein